MQCHIKSKNLAEVLHNIPTRDSCTFTFGRCGLTINNDVFISGTLDLYTFTCKKPFIWTLDIDFLDQITDPECIDMENGCFIFEYNEKTNKFDLRHSKNSQVETKKIKKNET